MNEKESLLKNLESCKKKMMCEGECSPHTDGLEVVRVRHNRYYDWGFFTYCSEAIAEDIRRGLTVLREGEEGFGVLRFVEAVKKADEK